MARGVGATPAADRSLELVVRLRLALELVAELGEALLAEPLLICGLTSSSVGALMFPRRWIFFGVLHGIAVMLIEAALSPDATPLSLPNFKAPGVVLSSLG